MKVLHVIPSVAPGYGGTSVFMTELARAQAQQEGVSVRVFCTDDDGRGGRYLKTDWNVPGAELVLVPARAGSVDFQRLLFEAASTADVIHAHSLWNPVADRARRAARSHRIPLVVSPHGMMSPYTWSRRRLARLICWWWRERGVMAAAAGLHGTTDAEAEELRGWQVTKRARFCVAPLGVEPRAWTLPVDPKALRQLCGPAVGNKPIVLYLSRLHPKKGVVDCLLPAFAALDRPAHLAIAGGGDPSAPLYPNEVRSAIERLGLTQRVSLLGEVALAERFTLFDGAAALVLPSHQENFGLVVAEAMARGCPVVVSRDVQCSTWVERGGGAVLTRNPAEWTTALRRILDDPAAAQATAERCRDIARVEFDWGRTAELLTGLYRDLTHPTRPA
jgi:glycosyltransferase involved in cell wall biosynthesis